MNILIYSHSSSFGGGENALKNLVSVLSENHSVSIIFPEPKGHLVDYFLAQNISCYQYPFTHAVPNLASTLVNYSETRISESLRALGLDAQKFDCVISNTVVLLEGIFASKYLGIPHITYAHEYLDDPNLEPVCFTSNRYLKIITNESHQLLTCSSFLKDTLGDSAKTEVLYPFNFSDPIEFSLSESDTTDVLVIGTRSIRKNMHFAVTVQKALRLRGRNVKMHFIGTDNTGSTLLQQTIANRNELVELHQPTLDPYFIKDRKVVTLITALTEPFGLTIVESMQRGIPVVSSKSGGPQELLKDSYLYEVNDLDGCVRSLENIIDNYNSSCAYSRTRYSQLQKKNSRASQIKVIDKVLKNAIKNYSNNQFIDPLLNNLESFKTIIQSSSQDEIISNIAIASSKSLDEVKKQLVLEQANHGASVLSDIHHYDVVPFAHSSKLDSLYKQGTGLAVELTATATDPNKKLMLVNILLKLLEFKETNPKMKILALGDGLGIDSASLVNCGFDVDYMDYDASTMTDIAKLNSSHKLKFVTEIKKKYDAVICLEVIEHVPDIFSFIEVLNNALKSNGLLIISECFDGVRDCWPTHLADNEQYASSLFLLLLPYFELVDYSTIPFGKPYVFSKRNKPVLPKDIAKALSNRTTMIELLNSKIRLGI